MSQNDLFSRLVGRGGQVVQMSPEKVRLGEFIDWQVRRVVGVNEDVGVSFKVRAAIRQEIPMLVGDISQVAAITVECLAASALLPKLDVGRVAARGQHHQLVVAEQWSQVARIVKCDELLDDTTAIRPPINVVAQRHNAILWPGGYEFEQLFQGFRATVDVTDGDSALWHESRLRNLGGVAVGQQRYNRRYSGRSAEPQASSSSEVEESVERRVIWGRNPIEQRSHDFQPDML